MDLFLSMLSAAGLAYSGTPREYLNAEQASPDTGKCLKIGNEVEVLQETSYIVIFQCSDG